MDLLIVMLVLFIGALGLVAECLRVVSSRCSGNCSQGRDCDCDA